MRGDDAVAAVAFRTGRARTKYLDNAPPYLVSLVSLHEGKKLAVVKLGKEKDVLGELLTRRNMADVWKRLDRRMSTDRDWLSLWPFPDGASAPDD